MCAVAIVAGFAISSCVKELGKEVAFEDMDFSNKAQVQVYNGTISSTRNFVYVDATPVNGSSMAYGATFPSTPSNFAITPGYKNFLIKDTLTTSTQPQMSFAENLAAGKYYTIFMYDTVNSPKQKIVTNDIVFPDDTTARMRFANFVFSKTAVPAVDIYSKRRGVTLFTNVQITEVTNFIPVPSSYTDTFYVRETGTTNLLATLNSVNPVQKRSYTLVFRGRYQSTSGTPVRTLSVFANN